MSDVAVHVDGISKHYRIGGPKDAYGTLRDTLVAAATSPLRAIMGRSGAQSDGFWALRDVSFDVKHGEVLGIIGRNGAGKSTLLKILSRITEPTKGHATIHGRVGSLLEVGTGFHPELTGRENIYLNGAILGISKRDIDRRFDEIVEFAGVEQFLDTPVKRYSSGMYTRLAFSVAAHLEPEILIVDEVLSVGDAAFQQKSLGKMQDVAKEGRTVLFVSHNMGAVRHLCSQALLLFDGHVLGMGPIISVLEQYLHSSSPAFTSSFSAGRHGVESEVGVTSVRVLDQLGRLADHIDSVAGATIEIVYSVTAPLKGVQIAFELWSMSHDCVFMTSNLDEYPVHVHDIHPVGAFIATCQIPPAYLRPGRYQISVEVSIPGVRWLDQKRNVVGFEVVDSGSVMVQLSQGRRGVVMPILPWQVQAVALTEAAIGVDNDS